MKKVMVFGVFDGLHEGHRAFLKEAKQCGDYLIAVLAHDHVVEHLKGRLPRLNFADRFEHLKKEDLIDEIAIGDGNLGTWSVLEKYKPDVIALGYDQESLGEALDEYLKNVDWYPEVKVMRDYEGNKNHSSIINSIEKPTL